MGVRKAGVRLFDYIEKGHPELVSGSLFQMKK